MNSVSTSNPPTPSVCAKPAPAGGGTASSPNAPVKDTLSPCGSCASCPCTCAPAPTYKNVKIHEEGPNYSSDADVPQIVDAENPTGAAAFNERLASGAETAVHQFGQEARSVAAGDDRPWQFSENAKPVYQDDHLIALRLVDYEFTAGAHGNAGVGSIIYDRKSGKEIKLTDLFDPKSGYLDAISKFAVDRLLTDNPSRDAAWVREGASPKADNFSSFIPGKEGLTITFQQYQVASYAEGTPTVTVPWSVLKPMLRPDSPVAYLAG